MLLPADIWGEWMPETTSKRPLDIAPSAFTVYYTSIRVSIGRNCRGRVSRGDIFIVAAFLLPAFQAICWVSCPDWYIIY